MQGDICLGIGTFDDTPPGDQEIKSLVSYGLTEAKVYQSIPSEQKISAQEVFEKWQQKEKNRAYLRFLFSPRSFLSSQ